MVRFFTSKATGSPVINSGKRRNSNGKSRKRPVRPPRGDGMPTHEMRIANAMQAQCVRNALHIHKYKKKKKTPLLVPPLRGWTGVWIPHHRPPSESPASGFSASASRSGSTGSTKPIPGGWTPERRKRPGRRSTTGAPISWIKRFRRSWPGPRAIPGKWRIGHGTKSNTRPRS